ncbi:MAG TPA: dihydrofolate reductase family protein [Solirubrobacteraceae bacterium]
MRRIVNSTYITLDGAIENPQDWPSGRHEDDGRGQEIQAELLLSCDALVLGRRTYEAFAPFWPTRSGDAYSDHINTMEKWVVSSTLTDPAWANTTVIAGDVAEEIRRRKAQPGGDIVQYGFGPLTRTLLEHGLLDELRLWVHPFLVGQAGPDDLLFRPGPTTHMDLVATTPLASGIVILTYAPA